MNKNRCIDAGREGCPCALAEHGACPVCGRLSGGTCEACSWQGSCIYSLFEQNGRQMADVRKERLLSIAETKVYSEYLKVFVVKADKGFCGKAQKPGAYVFVRPEDSEPWYDMPISVLKAEPERALLHLGVCRCGAKSGTLFEAEGKLRVRGVYYNGLTGLKNLRENPERALIYMKGIAAAPLRNFLDGGSCWAKRLSGICIYADPDKVGFDFFCDYFGDIPAEAVRIRSFAEEELTAEEFAELKREDVNVFALTSPYYADRIQTAADRSIIRPVAGTFCCGEGICGACTCVDDSGKTIHRCKAE